MISVPSCMFLQSDNKVCKLIMLVLIVYLIRPRIFINRTFEHLRHLNVKNSGMK